MDTINGRSSSLSNGSEENCDELALDLSNIGVWKLNLVTGDTRINRHFAEMLGYRNHELEPLTLEKWKSMLHPEDLDPTLKIFNAYVEGERMEYEARTRLRHKDGNYKWILTRGKWNSSSATEDEFFISGVHIDIDDLMRSKEKLTHHLEIEKIIYRITADMINVTIKTLDEKINSALREIGEYFNLDRTYVFLLRNESVIDNTHEWCNTGVMPTIHLLQGIPVEGLEWWYKEVDRCGCVHVPRLTDCEDKATVNLLMQFGVQSLMAVPLISDDRYIGLIGFDAVRYEKCWDQSEINILKSIAFVVSSAITAADREKRLIEATEKARESDRMKSAFLQSVSHELRTPLHHIIGFSELINEMKDADEISNFALMINSSGKKLLSMIEDLFDLSTFQDSRIRMRNETFLLYDLFNDLRNGFNDILYSSEKSAQVKNLFEAENELLDTIVTGDKSKINHILYSLYRNAIKFTDSGFIRFKIMKNEDNRLIFMIQDSGIGIEKDKQELIFKHFTRVDSSINTRYPGIGIGLSLAHILASAMNGQLYIDSEPGKGSAFYLTIPLN